MLSSVSTTVKLDSKKLNYYVVSPKDHHYHQLFLTYAKNTRSNKY